MGILLNGNKPSKIIYNGAESSLYFNGSKIWPEGDPYNPLNLPAKTIRIKMKSGSSMPSISGATVTAVQGQPDVYDVYKDSSNWYRLIFWNSKLLEVLGANTTEITNMQEMFFRCESLVSVALFDTSNVTITQSMFFRCTSLTTLPLFNTSNVTNMLSMCNSCTSLTSIPLFNTSKAANMASMFDNCTNVQSGALALYQQASTQANPPSNHAGTFRNCGANTTTGAAELAQIPEDWK